MAYGVGLPASESPASLERPPSSMIVRVRVRARARVRVRVRIRVRLGVWG